MRIFNRFKLLEEGTLKEDLLRLCDRYGVQVKKIVVRDASRRTTRANAFCTGLTKRMTISLDDNLVKDYENDQIVAVFAHEFAHAKYGHVLKSLPFSLMDTVLTIVMLGVDEYKELLKSLGVEGEWEGIGHCAIGYADGNLPAAAARKENRVFWAE